MSDDLDTDAETLTEAANSREHLLELLEDALDEAHHKAASGRVYDAENEKVRQGWFRTLGYLTGQYRQLLNDKELEEMEERIQELEAAGSGPTASTRSVATDGGIDE